MNGVRDTGNKSCLPAEVNVEAIDGHGEGGGGAAWEEEGRGGSENIKEKGLKKVWVDGGRDTETKRKADCNNMNTKRHN